MSNLEVRAIANPKELDEMYHQRWLVLRAPLGMDRGTEKDIHDEKAFHLVAILTDKIVGSARLVELSPELGNISYVAVLPDFQKQGIGTKLMEKLIEQSRKKNLQRLKLKSRITAVNFYQKLGFSAAGEPFDYLGIPHVFMYLDIPAFPKQDADW
jgi:predicted GNAT family N-acyltransferase